MTTELRTRIARLRQDFHVGFAETADDFEELHRLRYDVFCSQRGILPGQAGTEVDSYDSVSRHVVLRRRGGGMVGTVRLVLGVDGDRLQRFPMQRVCDQAVFARIPLETTGEISRFCLSRERRDTDEHADTVLRLGLMKGILLASEEARLTHWCAAMEKGLLRLLQLADIWFEPIGPPIEYFGTRQPAVADIAEVLRRGERERRLIWEYVTDKDRRTAVVGRPLPRSWMLDDMRLHNDLETLRQQTAVVSFAALALSNDNLNETLAEACRLVGGALQTDLVRILELLADRRSLLVRASTGFQVTSGDGTIANDDAAAALALKNGEPVVSSDIKLETRCSYTQYLFASGVRAAVNVVITDDRRRVAFGVLQIFRREANIISDKDIQFLRSYAALVAAAADRLNGIESARRGEEQLRVALTAGRSEPRKTDAADDAAVAGVTRIRGAKHATPDALPAFARPGALRVLVVDDAAINRDITAAFLRAAAYEVVLAGGGAQAVEIAATEVFDLILMDVRMPDVDGLEATRRIRANSNVCGRVPILALSGRVFAEQIEECRQVGMDGHLGKPFTQEMLLKAVSEAIGRSVRVIGSHGQRGPSTTTYEGHGMILNQATFERTTVLLPPSLIECHLRTLIQRSETLLRGLSVTEAEPAGATTLSGASHILAGSAGMFGFERLAAVTGLFEHASQGDKAKALKLVPVLAATIQASLEEMRLRVPVRIASQSTPSTDSARNQGTCP